MKCAIEPRRSVSRKLNNDEDDITAPNCRHAHAAGAHDRVATL
jgi:hypothetical protein